jgi:hypothetical protein
MTQCWWEQLPKSLALGTRRTSMHQALEDVARRFSLFQGPIPMHQAVSEACNLPVSGT